MGRTFCIGDIHGEFDKLTNLMVKCKFNMYEDTLIALGDYVDRGANPMEVMIFLYSLENFIGLWGNHDFEFYKDTVLFNRQTQLGPGGGSEITYAAWQETPPLDREIIMKFLSSLKYNYTDKENRFFVHGGFNRHKLVNDQSNFLFLWDRDFFTAALSYSNMSQERMKHPFKIKDDFKEVYLGHTPTIYWDIPEPILAGNNNVINLDTGCGKGGLLTIMDIDTKEFWQA